MRILMVVQRYGPTIAGGAEHLVRQYALRLRARGHDVEVLSSCADSYANWANVWPAGTTFDDGITLHRLPVAAPRDNTLFGPLHQRVSASRIDDGPASPVLTSCWMNMIGPELAGIDRWLFANASRFDVVVFSGYLYTPSTRGLPFAAPFAPTVLQPVAHDEAALRLPVMRELFDHACAINYLTDEERLLVEQRFRPTAISRVFGAGVNDVPADLPRDVRQRFGIGDDPYLVCVGRIDPAKGMHELAGYFRTYLERHPEERLRLVFVGSEVHPIERHPAITVTGFVDEPTKWALLAGASILVQPSFFESFSLSLAEGWRCALPALVQGRNDVLAGQVGRSDGGLAYRTYAEFDVELTHLLNSPYLREYFGYSGQRYVERYNWDLVLDSFELLLVDARDAWTASGT